MMSRDEFKALSPRERGYAVYMLGARKDEPHVPNEINPYPMGSKESAAWVAGQFAAVLAAQDSEE